MSSQSAAWKWWKEEEEGDGGAFLEKFLLPRLPLLLLLPSLPNSAYFEQFE